MKTENVRAIAARLIHSLSEDKGSLTNLLSEHLDHPEYSYLQELCFGTCRHYFLLQGLLKQLLNKPIKAKDHDLRCLLLLGLYQLRELSTADYAVINETVNAAIALDKGWAKGFVNGVLRNYQRNRDVLDTKLSQSEQVAFPQWLFAAIRKQWPEQSDSIFSNSNQRPPLTLRVNKAKGTREQQLQILADAEIPASAGALSSAAIYLEQARPVMEIPGFSDGRISVQDEASQLVPGLLDLKSGLRVLDACAAPGGKTCHIAESEQSLTELTAIDTDARRVARIEENLQRLGLRATLLAADARNTTKWWKRKPHYDRILLDAPCSATGVIRRHPDIKVLRRANDLPRLVELQQQLLGALWPCLAPGGLLLYTTCSLLREENENQIEQFLSKCEDAKYEGITADWGVECRYGRQLLTGTTNEPDGFYFALLRKE